MTDRQLRIDIDVVTRKAQQALNASEADAKKLGKQLDDTRSAADRVAEAIEAMAEATQSEMKQAEAASAALARAIGPELASRLQQSGESADQWTMKLNAMGLSFRDIEDDAERLAAAIRRVDDARPAVNNLEASTQHAAVGVRRVGAEADQTRSVLANMVGNSVQDLGQLGGVAGSAGVLIGQIGEYAAEGQIGVKQLAGLAVPMAGLAAGTWLVSDAMGDVAAAKAFRREQVDGYTAALKAADSELAAIRSKLEDAGKIQIRIFDENYDVTPALAMAGLNVTTFSQLVAGGKPKIDAWADAMRDAGIDGDVLATVLRALNSESSAYAAAQDAAAASAEFFGEKNRYAGMTSVEIAAALKHQAEVQEYVESRTAESADATEDATDSSDNYADALARVRQELEDARQALRDWYDTQLEAIGADHEYLTSVARAQQATAKFNQDLADGKLAGDEMTIAIESTVEAMSSAAEGYATASGEIESTQGYIDAMIESLYNQASTLEPGSRLWQAVTGYIAQLNNIPRNVTTRAEFDDSRMGRHASGGSDNRPFIAGENGPEIVDPQGRSARVFMAGESSSIFRGLGRSQNVTHTSISNAPATAPSTPVAAAAAVEKDAAVELARTQADARAEQRRIWELMYADNEINLEQLRANLQGQVGVVEKYSTEYGQIRSALRSLDREEEQKRREETKAAADEEAAREKAKNEALKAALEERQAIFDAARARRAAADAADEANAAVSDLTAAGLEYARVAGSKKAKPGEADAATADVMSSAKRAAEALYRRADTSANALGLTDDTVEWSRFVRSVLEGDAQASGGPLAEAIGRILTGIPALADGGVVKARPGGTIVRVAEAGQDEAITPLDRAGVGGPTIINLTANIRTSADPNASVAALQRFSRYNGGRWLTKLSSGAA